MDPCVCPLAHVLEDKSNEKTMAFVVLQLRGKSCKIYKPWFGVNVGESVSLRQVFNDFISGSLDGQIADPDTYDD